MQLIIAEKPSVARTIASALNLNKKGDGFYENNKYIVTWAFGHLFTLNDVDDYLKEKRKWSEVPLPFFPNKYEFKLKENEGIKKQFDNICNLINRNDVSEIINCGDADREGQVIIDLIIKNANNSKPIKRLWIQEQTENTIKNEISKIQNNSNYSNYFNEGIARTYIDWIIGINLTRHLSLKSNTLLPVGRVLIPIVKHIYDRDMEIKKFKKEEYYILESKTMFDNIELLLSLQEEKYSLNEYEKIKDLSEKLNKEKAIVNNIEEKEINKYPGKLFSLSKLQSELSTKYKIDFATSLKHIQDLYEKGYITYPRTNTEYLAENEKDKIKEIINLFKDEHNIEFKDTKKIFDDSKIESHSAITPTGKKIANLSEIEESIYNVVLNRFLSNFLIDVSTISQRIIEIAHKGNIFVLKGETLLNEGFFKYEPKEFKNHLPLVEKGQELDVNFKPTKKTTSPPKKITESELSFYLENPFKKESDNTELDENYIDILRGMEIGTQATRTGIVENAKKYKYISQKGQTYSIEKLGEDLINVLDTLKIDLYKNKSVEISMFLKEIFHNKKTIDEAIEYMENEIKNAIENTKEIEIQIEKEEKEIIGNCPLCKRPVYESKVNFFCSGVFDEEDKCNFALFKKDNYFKSFNKTITKTFAKSILKNNKAVMKNLESKKGNKYNAEFSIIEYKPYLKWDMKFTK